MTRGRHEKEDDQSKEAEGLKRKIRDAAIPRIAEEETHQRIHISQRMKLEECKTAMCQAQQKSRYPKMTAVVEQWKKTTIEACQRPDTQHDVQKQEGRCPQSANQQRLRGCAWVAPSSYAEERSEIKRKKRQQGDVVHLLLSVPTDGGILHAHGSLSTLAVSTTVW